MIQVTPALAATIADFTTDIVNSTEMKKLEDMILDEMPEIAVNHRLEGYDVEAEDDEAVERNGDIESELYGFVWGEVIRYCIRNVSGLRVDPRTLPHS